MELQREREEMVERDSMLKGRAILKKQVWPCVYIARTASYVGDVTVHLTR